VIKKHDPQLVHQHGGAEIGHGAIRPSARSRNLIGKTLDEVTELWGCRKRAVQRELLPPSGHALYFSRDVIAGCCG